MKALCTGDWHLEAGGHLGHTDPELGSTRLGDARRILGKVSTAECDVLLFLGDLAQTARPGPVAYAIAAEALAKSPAKAIVMLHGNHDHGGERYSCLNVVGDGMDGVTVVTAPQLLEVGDLQVGCLPWTPPSRLFAKAPHQPRKMSRLVAERLIDVARGLGGKLDPERPSILIGHWLVAGEKLASGVSVMETREPLVQAADLEASGPWDAIVFGHNHLHQQIANRVWSCGPPMRGGFGEEGIPTGYMVVEWS